VKGFADLIKALLRAYNTSGPIYRLSILSHGSPGILLLDNVNIGKFGTWLYQKELGDLPADLFVKDAEIVLLACDCAQGTVINPNKGIDKIKAIFAKFAKKGAKVVASRQSVDATYEGFDETDIVSQLRKTKTEMLERAATNYLVYLSIPIALCFLPFLKTYSNLPK